MILESSNIIQFSGTIDEYFTNPAKTTSKFCIPPASNQKAPITSTFYVYFLQNLCCKRVGLNTTGNLPAIHSEISSNLDYNGNSSENIEWSDFGTVAYETTF